MTTKQLNGGYWAIRMLSEEYGSEEFSYGSLEEARAGFKRLKRDIARENDGITRQLELVLVVDSAEVES